VSVENCSPAAGSPLSRPALLGPARWPRRVNRIDYDSGRESIADVDHSLDNPAPEGDDAEANQELSDDDGSA
jgi:hypothetical protein